MKYKPILTKHGYYYTNPPPTQGEIKKYYEEKLSGRSSIGSKQ